MAIPHSLHLKIRGKFLQPDQFLQFHPIPDRSCPNQSTNVPYLKAEKAYAPTQGGLTARTHALACAFQARAPPTRRKSAERDPGRASPFQLPPAPLWA